MEYAKSKIHERTGHASLPASFAMLQEIKDRSVRLGSDVLLLAKSASEECERELEEEEEEEQEQEKARPRLIARKESDWDYKSALTWPRIVSNLPGMQSAVISIRDAVRGFISTEDGRDLNLVNWDDKVFCTFNFLHSVSTKPYDYTLRPVNVGLVFPSGQVLLLSQRETDAFLPLFWATPSTGVTATTRLVHLSSVSDRDRYHSLALPYNALSSTTPRLAEETIACMELFNGETSYPSTERRLALAAMLAIEEASGAPRRLVELRGLDHMYEKSDLESVCDDVARQLANTRQAMDSTIPEKVCATEPSLFTSPPEHFLTHRPPSLHLSPHLSN